ncbi:hypothetical protein ACWEIJ_20430 [Lentzea sp. NPDC004789]
MIDAGDVVRLGEAHDGWSARLDEIDPRAHADAVRAGAAELGVWAHGGHVPMQPFVLPGPAMTALHDIGAGLQDLLIRHALDACGGDLVELAGIAGLTDSERWFLPSARPLPEALGCRRADVFVEAGRPRFLELNFGTCLNGTTAAPVLASTLLGTETGRAERRTRNLRTDSFFAARLRWLRDNGADGHRVALLGFAASGDEGSLRAFEEEAAYFATHGVACDFVPVEEAEVIRGSLVWRGKAYGAAIRYFMASPKALAGYADFFVALEQATGTILFGAYVSQLFTSKTLLADLVCDPRLSDAERALVDHVPWTARLRPGAVRRGGGTADPVEWAEGNRTRAVVKPANLYGSRGVVLGPSVTDDEWLTAVRDAVTEGGYVVQELVVPDPWRTRYWDSVADAPVEVTSPVLLGPFVVGGRSGGCFAQQPITGTAEDLLRPGNGLSFGVAVSAG